jgi:Flp pilus assembly protein TadG
VRWRKSESGVALVEFALVLPFLAVILFGIVDMGRAYRFENRLRNAAREGAQLAQANPEKLTAACSTRPSDNIDYKVRNEDTGITSLNPTITVLRTTSGGTTTTVTGCPPADSFAVGDKITVRVQAPFQILTPLISNLVGSPLTLTGSQDVDLQR